MLNILEIEVFEESFFTSNREWFFIKKSPHVRCLSDRKELIDLCKNATQDNNSELDIINEFEENYKSERAIYGGIHENDVYIEY